MKSTIYQHHLRASASFSYRHLLHWKRGDPVSGAFPALPHRRGRCGQFRDKSAGSGRRSPDVDTWGAARPARCWHLGGGGRFRPGRAVQVAAEAAQVLDPARLIHRSCG